jgi:catechol 2,3-dioxygenase-like lactoylglutathione lyase family enzyme
MGVMRLNRAMIYVNNLEPMAGFYQDILGLKPIPETRLDTYVEFEAGAATFALHAIPIGLRCELSSPPRPRENTPVKLSFEVDNVAAERKRLEALGVPIIQRPWGACDGVDPEGNVFGIYSSDTA